MKMILIDPETQHPQCVDVTDELHDTPVVPRGYRAHLLPHRILHHP